MKPNLTRISLILLLALVAGGLAACGNGQAKVPEEKDEPPTIPVEVAAVSVGTITAFYSTTATLEAEHEARVVPRLGGRIVELLVEEGDVVEAGQTLARIDNERYQLELSRAEATLRRLEQDFNRNREMYARNLISSEQFERAKFEFDAQKAGFDIAFLELSYTDITSPIDGVVSERMIKIGNTVNTQDPVFVVTKMDPLLATLHVPERELARLRPGQVASVAVDALAGRRFDGRIARISPVVDPTTGTFRVTVEVNADGALMPGMFGRVDIIHDTRVDTMLIPVAAVLAEDARTTVFVVNDGTATRRDVQVGYRNNGSIEILEGLVPGELVVVTGQASLRNDSKVSIVSGGEAVPAAEEAVTEGDE